MRFHTETDLNRCCQWWKKFSPQRSLFDLWEYRHCFYSGYGYQPYFIIGFEAGIPIGILPLWYEKKGAFYTFFGGTFPEPNRFLIKDKSKLALFLKQCPQPTRLYYLERSETKYYPLAESETNYSLDLSQYRQSIERFFLSFKKKHRKNLRYDLRQFEKNDYRLRYNFPNDLDEMINLNRQRFQKASDLNEKEMETSIRELAGIALKQGRLSLVSLLVKEKIEAVEMAVVYNHCYYVLCGGHNLEIENIGKRMIIEHLKLALKGNVSRLDFLSTDSGWKKLWHFKTKSFFEFKN